MQADRAAVSAALASLGSSGVVDDGWARLVAVTGPREEAASVLRVTSLLIVAVPVLLLLLHSPGAGRVAELKEAVREIAARPDRIHDRPAREGTADVRFVDAIDALRRDGQAAVLRDECCADHDAEGPADDGLLALRLRKPAVSVLVMYDDVDQSRSLSRGDLVRWVSLAPEAQAMRQLPVQLASHHR